MAMKAPIRSAKPTRNATRPPIRRFGGLYESMDRLSGFAGPIGWLPGTGGGGGGAGRFGANDEYGWAP